MPRVSAWIAAAWSPCGLYVETSLKSMENQLSAISRQPSRWPVETAALGCLAEQRSARSSPEAPQDRISATANLSIINAGAKRLRATIHAGKMERRIHVAR